MNIKNNQRFRDTEVRMQAAMLDLMKNTAFDKITVKKICEKADVNRSTFYAHFIDIYDLLDKMELELRKELLNNYSTTSSESRQIFSIQSFIPFLQHIKKHSYFYKINLQTRRSFPLEQGYDSMWHQIIKPRCECSGITNEAEMMYYFIAFQAGFTFALKHWVDSDCKETESKMAEILENCIPTILRI